MVYPTRNSPPFPLSGEALNRLCHFFPTADREVVQAVMQQCTSESKAVRKLLDQGFPMKKVPIPRA